MLKSIYLKSINLLILIFLFVSFQGLFSKENRLVGIWQKDSPIIASAYVDCFIFYPNGKFIFYFNQYNDAKIDYSFGGKYKLVKDTLIIKVEFRETYKNGYYRLGDLNTVEDATSIVYDKHNATLVKEKLKQKWDKTPIKFKKKKGEDYYFEVNTVKYYLVEKDPSKYM